MKLVQLRLVRLFLLALLIGGSSASLSAGMIDMRPNWDASRPLANPHKGWYHHYPDNHIKKYEIAQDADLLEFPGMDHLYLRLAWAYLEPKEGWFKWSVIDSIIDKWTAQGLGIAFRISCRETGTDRIEQQFATPLWVKEAGAQGGHFYRGKGTGPEGPWEPVYDDPIFLQKLEQFLKTFAKRYDGKPWLRYMDIGSLGDWGEGHTWSGSRREYGYDARKIHVDLHLKYFHETQLIVSDDFVYGIADPEDRKRMHRYVMDQGISYRDDSILVNGYLAGYSDRYTVRSPEFFEDVYRKTPTVFELEHYGSVKKLGNWLGAPQSLVVQHGQGKLGPDYFRGALGLLRATYIGYHGYAHEWLADNPELTGELLNRCGYWFFPHQIELPDTLTIGKLQNIAVVWENRGVAPAYHAYPLVLRLQGEKTVDIEITSGNQKWMPSEKGGTFKEQYRVIPSRVLIPGSYTLKMKLYSKAAGRDVLLPLRAEIRDQDGFYTICPVKIVSD